MDTHIQAMVETEALMGDRLRDAKMQAISLAVYLFLRDRKESLSRLDRDTLRAIFDEYLADCLPETVHEQYLAEVVDAVHEKVTG